jgi:hypothetical protein
MPETKGIPVIDPNVKHVGVSKLRTLSASRLRSLDKTLVIQDDDTPLAVVLSYEQFMEMQQEREQILATLETVFEKEESSNLLTALQQTKEGNTKPFSSIRKTLREKNPKREIPDEA